MKLRISDSLQSIIGTLRAVCATILAGGIGMSAGLAQAQVFDSGSDGSDGALTFVCAPGGETIEWDPDAAGLDADGDRVFEFTTVEVPADCTISLTTSKLGLNPVAWLATGAVTIDGAVDLSGANGHGHTLGSIRVPAAPGPGGFAGGLGPVDGVGDWTDGFGPGKGIQSCLSWGTGGGYGTEGFEDFCGGATPGGASYGNEFILPLIGGSGGSGRTTGGGGGAGGGALLIASSASVAVGGEIRANGGNGANQAGGGSGGAIRLVAPVVSGAGGIFAAGGLGGNANRGRGGSGRIRVQTYDHQFTGSRTTGALFVTLAPTTTLFGGAAFGIPSVQITQVSWDDPGGAPRVSPVPSSPSGGFSPADVTIETVDPVVIEIESLNVPVGTTVMVEIHGESIGTSSYESSPLAGVGDPLTATVLAPIDPGFSAVTLRADFSSP